MQALTALLMILGGCVVNTWSLELIVRQDPGSGGLVTFFQFAFIALVALARDASALLRPRAPFRWHLLLTSLFFVLSIINNKVFVFGITPPLHMLFRSSTLVGSLVVGLVFFRKEYTRRQIVSCLVITLGVFVYTLADLERKQQEKQAESDGECCSSFPLLPLLADDFRHDPEKTLGIALMTVALLITALLGHLQERLYRYYPDTHEETLFFQHFLALPYFMLLSGDIGEHVAFWKTLDGFVLADMHVPYIWLHLAVNLYSQYVCIRGVFNLTAASGTLTTTLALTCRKMLSLMCSVVYFNNSFGLVHAGSAALVFGGTMIYSNVYERVLGRAPPSPAGPRKPKTD